MKRDYIDFHEVSPAHEGIDERLKNWARSLNGRRSDSTSPTFKGYQSAAITRWDQEAKMPVDHEDARIVAQGIIMLPVLHRKTVQWCYSLKSSPTAGIRYVFDLPPKVSREEAREKTAEMRALLWAARDMLVTV